MTDNEPDTIKNVERIAMVNINAQDFLDELRFDIQTRDKIKASLVLAHFEEVDAGTQKLALYEMGKAPGDFVLPLLVSLLANIGTCCTPMAEMKRRAVSKPALLKRPKKRSPCLPLTTPG